MLAMTDTPIESFLPVFASTGIPVAFLVPTPTGFGKSIMDAIAPVRNLLKDAGLQISCKKTCCFSIAMCPLFMLKCNYSVEVSPTNN